MRSAPTPVPRHRERSAARGRRLSPLLLAGIQFAVAQPVTAQSEALPSAAPMIRFAADGNTLLPPEALAEILKPVAGPLTIDKLREVADRLQRRYQQQGFGAVVVALPKQEIFNDTVRLQVIEGKLTSILFKGNRHFSERNIRSSTPSLHLEKTPHLIAIDANLSQLNENPAKSTRVTFLPGKTLGSVEAIVLTTDRDPLQQSVAVENSGSSATGRWRLSYSLRHANLFDRDHMLGLRAELSPIDGAHSNTASLSYQVPFYRYRSAFELVASYSDVESRDVQTAAGDASFTGRGSSYGARYRYFLPRYLAVRHRAYMALDARTYNTDCTVGEFGRAGCGSAATQFMVRPLTLGYEARVFDRYSISLSYSRNFHSGGSSGRGAETSGTEAGTTSVYGVLRGGLSTSYRLPRGSSVTLRGSLQYSDDALIPGEQFGIGGSRSVRGYAERELAGDRGQFAVIEFTSAPWRVGAREGSPASQVLTGLAFVDWGRVENNRGVFCSAQGSSCTASSLGVGLLWRYRNHWSLRADLAGALEDGAQTAAGDVGAHFSLSYRF